ncbi:MAG: heme/copper-type cytochrome/quinol oxidase subunit 1 [Verrucomicrobiales bacterium]|jgi:heme/copper-type cytochrome/quinol oxidase subunit 1
MPKGDNVSMTATDTHTEIHDDHGLVDTTQTGDGLYQLVASNDHKMVGRLWIGASLLLLIAIMILGLVNSLERVSLGDTEIFGSVTKYFQSWVLFRTGAIFMVAIPLFIGIATAIVPLQVGSASIAFPRLVAASFWSWLFASGVHIASFGADGGLGPEAGTRTEGTLLTIVSLGFMIVALLAASVCIATTIVALRPEGMSLLRVPAFTWSMLVATSVWLFSLPVLIANLIYSYVDLQGRLPIEFGLRDTLWSRVEWAWSQPQVFAYAIPVLGVLAEIVPVSAKHRQANRNVLLSLIGLFGVLSFGAWAQSFLSRGADPAFQVAANSDDRGVFLYDEFLYIVFGLAIVIPVLALLGGVLDTIRRGSTPKPDAALLGSIAGALLLLAAVVAGELRVWPWWWEALHEDHVLLSSSSAILSLVLAAVVASAVGALAFWAPKIFGGYAKDSVAMTAVMLFLGGGLLAGMADMISAFSGQPDISVTNNVDSIVDTMNVMVVIGVAMMAVGALALLGALIPAARSNEQLPDDPWDGHTLEWAAPSPPPIGNFIEQIPTVSSAEPLLDEFEEVS